MSHTSVMAGPSADAAGPSPARGSAMRRWQLAAARFPWVLPALFTAAVVGFRITRPPLWRDELATWSAASRPFGDLFRMLGNIDAAAAPYYLLMTLWIGVFGDSALALRLPSLLAMAGAAAVTTVLGRRLFGTAAGVTGGLLFALVPAISRYGQEARPYALTTLLAVLATWLLVRALDEPSWRRWAGYAACVAGLGLAHVLALFLLAGHAVAVLLAWRVDRQPKALRWVAAVAAAGALLVVPVSFALGQQGKQLNWVGTPDLDSLLGAPGGVVGAEQVAGALVALAVLGAFLAGRWGLVLGTAVLGSVLLLFVGGLVTPLWVTRYLTFAIPLLCLLAGVAASRTALAGARRVVAIALLVLIVGGLGVRSQVSARKTHEGGSSALNYGSAARVIDRNDQPGDGIVYGDRGGWFFLDIGTEYHLGDNKPRDVLAERTPGQQATFWAAECAQPTVCLAGTRRLWVLTRSKTPTDELQPATAAAITAAYRPQQTWRAGGFTVTLYQRIG